MIDTMIDLMSLKIFMWIFKGETHSFGEAAKEFNMAQPAIGARMKQLEQILEVPLFERHGNKVTLRPKGRELLGYAERLISLYEETIEAICDRSTTHDLVRLGVSETINQTWLSTLFARVKAARPNLEFVLDVDASPYLLDRLVARHLDLAFFVQPSDPRNVPIRWLCEFPMAFVACDRIRDEIGSPHEPIPLKRIPEYDLVTFSRNTQPYMDLRALLLREGLQPKIHACASMEIVVRLALEGLAIAVIPPAILENKVEAREKLRPLNTTVKLPELNFVAGWSDGAMYHVAKRVAEIAVEVAHHATKS
jgi:DNA-binding transcriptional LysR family regulator